MNELRPTPTKIRKRTKKEQSVFISDCVKLLEESE